MTTLRKMAKSQVAESKYSHLLVIVKIILFFLLKTVKEEEEHVIKILAIKLFHCGKEGQVVGGVWGGVRKKIHVRWKPSKGLHSASYKLQLVTYILRKI